MLLSKENMVLKSQSKVKLKLTIKLPWPELWLNAENPGIKSVAKLNTNIYYALTHMHRERTKASFLRELGRLLLDPKSRTADEVDFKLKTDKSKHQKKSSLGQLFYSMTQMNTTN